MTQFPRFESSNKARVWKLRKSIYGLKRVPGAWFDKLKYTLSYLSFYSYKYDGSLNYYFASYVIIFLSIYVDDIIVSSKYSQTITRLTSILNQHFALKNLGELSYFICVDAHRACNGGLHLN